MEEDTIRDMRMSLGRFLHSYYLKFGEEKYNRFIERMGYKMSNLYGSTFDSNSLRIMEAEYVIFNKLHEENKYQNKKTTSER